MVVCQQEDAFNEMSPHLWVVHHWQVNQDGTQYLSHLRRGQDIFLGRQCGAFGIGVGYFKLSTQPRINWRVLIMNYLGKDGMWAGLGRERCFNC